MSSVEQRQRVERAGHVRRVRDRIVVASQHLGQGQRRARHADRVEHPLAQRDRVGVTEVVRRPAIGHRRGEAARRHHLVAVLVLLAVGRGQGQLRHPGDQQLGGELERVEDELEVAPGEAGAGAEGVARGQARRQLRVGDGEGRQQVDQRRLPAQPSGVDEGGRQQRAERLGDRADPQQGVGGDRRRLPDLADAKALQENDLAALDDGDRRAGHARLGQLRRDIGLERGQSLAGQRQWGDAGQVGDSLVPVGWRPGWPPHPLRGSGPVPAGSGGQRRAAGKRRRTRARRDE